MSVFHIFSAFKKCTQLILFIGIKNNLSLTPFFNVVDFVYNSKVHKNKNYEFFNDLENYTWVVILHCKYDVERNLSFAPNIIRRNRIAMTYNLYFKRMKHDENDNKDHF